MTAPFFLTVYSLCYCCGDKLAPVIAFHKAVINRWSLGSLSLFLCLEVSETVIVGMLQRSEVYTDKKCNLYWVSCGEKKTWLFQSSDTGDSIH